MLALDLAKTFSAAKTIDNPALNRVGLQVGRIMLARGIQKTRRFEVDPAASAYVDTLLEEGCLRINNFLDDELFKRLEAEAERQLVGEGGTLLQHGRNQVRMCPITTSNPVIKEVFESTPLRQIVEGVEKRHLDFDNGSLRFERLQQGVGESGEHAHDPETEMHVDTFFSTHKFWLYLDDVTPEKGPLTYVPRSHLLQGRLRPDYDESIGSNYRSRRISQDEIDQRGLHVKVFDVPANTLVVANVFGYHCRQLGELGQTRRAFHGTFRYNPFLPRRIRNDLLSRKNPVVKRVMSLMQPRAK